MLFNYWIITFVTSRLVLKFIEKYILILIQSLLKIYLNSIVSRKLQFTLLIYVFMKLVWHWYEKIRI